MCDSVSKRTLLSLNGMTAFVGISGIVGGIVMKLNVFAIFQNMPVDMMRVMGSQNVTDAMEVASDFVRTAPYLIIALGSIILLISVCGYIGAKLGKIWLLRVYKIVLFLLLGALGVLTALIFTKEDVIHGIMNSFVEGLFVSYSNKPSGELMDVIQVHFKCCGINSSKDWEKVQAWQETAKNKAKEEETYLGDDPVPDSCCMQPRNKLGCGLAHSSGEKINITKIYDKGCNEMVWFTVKENAVYIGLGALVIGTLMLLCILLSCFLISIVNKPPEKQYKE